MHKEGKEERGRAEQKETNKQTSFFLQICKKALSKYTVKPILSWFNMRCRFLSVLGGYVFHLNPALVKIVPLLSVGCSCMHMNRPSPVCNNYVKCAQEICSDHTRRHNRLYQMYFL